MKRTIALLLLTPLLFAGASAQEAAAEAQAQLPEVAEKAVAALDRTSAARYGQLPAQLNLPERDPFSPATSAGTAPMMFPGAGANFMPGNTQAGLPKLKFRGVLSSGDAVGQHGGDGKPLLALLEIVGDDVYMVRVGDELSYNPTSPLAAIKIVGISRLSVTVQVGTLSNQVIIR